MKKLFLLGLLTLLGIFSARATDFAVNGISYNILSGTDNEVEVAIGSSSYSGSVVIPTTVEYDGTTYSVTAIGSYAFEYCSKLTSVTIPKSVTSIGYKAFEGCTGLTSVEWNAINCGDLTQSSTFPTSTLTSITFGEEVAYIPAYLCYGQSELTSVTIPKSVTSIGNDAFENCSKLTSVEWNAINCGDLTQSSTFPTGTLTSITFGEEVAYIPAYLCYGQSELTSVEIPNSVTSIGKQAFWNCPGLTSVTIPNSVTAIGQEAFEWCTGLTSVTIGKSVNIMGWGVFNNCSGLRSVAWNARLCQDCSDPFPQTLTSITFGDQVEYIPAYLCANQNLTSVTIPNSVTAIGSSAFKDCNSLASVTIGEGVISIGDYAFANCHHLTSVTIGEGVTSIGNNAFADCYHLTSVTIPNSVTAIGNEAFKDCRDLTSVTIPNSVTAINPSVFDGCSGLTSVTIPNSVTAIGNEAFKSCSGLTSVTIPNSVTAIGEEAFSHCSGLTSVTIGEGVSSIGYKAFEECTELTSVEWNARNCQDMMASPFPDNLTSITFSNKVAHIPANLCYGISGLTSVTIGEGVTSIGDDAFDCDGLTSVEWNAENCQDYQGFTRVPFPTSLTSITFGDKVAYIPAYLCYKSGLRSVTIPNSVTAIGSSAFAYCSHLASVTIGGGLTTISSTAFAYTGLTSVTIPNSVDSIGDYAFYECGDLTSVTIPNSVTAIGEKAFSRSGLTSVTIPNSVTSIGSSVFASCSHLTSVTIPNSVTAIGDEAFKDCNKLTSVTIPNSVTSIGKEAFAYCYNLTSVTIPPSVTSIGDYAFADGIDLTSVISLAKTPPTCGSSAFAGIDTLYVRCGCKADYEAAVEWSSFSEIIEWCVYTVTLQVNDETMGSVTGDKEYAYDGTQATLTATANEGYHFEKWSDGNTDNPRILTVTQDTTLTAVFAINIYTVSVSANDDAMGEVTVTGGDKYAHGTEITVTATPNAGYHFEKWNDGETANPRTLTVTQDTTLTAVFAINIYTVSVSANDDAMGAVTVTGGDEYAHGTEITVTATPNAGYHFEKWSDGETANPRTLTVTQDTTLTAVFAINTFTLSVSANKPEWGSVSQSGNGTYDSASAVTITATPNEGYRFVNWTKGTAVFSIHADTTFTIKENLELTANFEKIPDEPVVVKTFTVSVSANKPEWGSASQSGNGTYDSASAVTITATPNEGYRFINWTKGTAVFSTHADTTFTIKENMELTANFEKLPADSTANEAALTAAPFAYVQGRTAYLSDNLGEVEAFTATGRRVYRGYDRTIALPNPGVYILRVVADGRRSKVIVK